jgi:hypothetical protein
MKWRESARARACLASVCMLDRLADKKTTFAINLEVKSGIERPRGRSTPKGVCGQQELAWSKGKRQTGSAAALLSRSRRCTVTERDQKGRSWKGVRLCVDVCRGGIIDSPPPLKTALSPFISIIFLFVFACLHFHLLDNFSHTLFLPSAAVSRSRRVHPRAAFTPAFNWIRTPDLSLGPRRTIPTYSSCSKPTACPSRTDTLSLSLSRSIHLLSDTLLRNDDNDETPRL